VEPLFLFFYYFFNEIAKVVVVQMEGEPDLCKIDEVGELCIQAYTTGISFFGLAGRTNNTFKVSLNRNSEESEFWAIVCRPSSR